MAIIKDIGVSLVVKGLQSLQWFSGPSRVMLDDSVENHVTSITATSVHEFDLTIHCQATYFKREHFRFWMPTRRMAVYSISVVVPRDAPPRLREAADNFSVNFPRECTLFTREVFQKQRAIEAYLDLLLAKMDRRQPERTWW